MAVFMSGERRLVLRMLDYWEYLRGERAFPKSGQIDPGVLGDDWPNCLMVDAGTDNSGWLLRAVGDNLKPDVPDKMLGRRVSDCGGGSFLGLATSYIPKVIEKRVPVAISGEIKEGDHKVLYRSILLPFSDDGEQVNAILGAANRLRQVELSAGSPASGI